ncbi:toluene tolerance protein [Pseudomonas vanderleydeniana]|uniref:Toluene tolerance protein n=1 Tax=Pseudomonas vanderleydeniana TaxID=2745495 RepID=A0A9E6PMM3_9PSED|nr:toluene tolerance protein [Pseudomonas vanderleydeniana]QXI29027.1 toluene tolerance protein [Pseudomonas vanderleydeniana]
MQCSRLSNAALNSLIDGAKILEADSFGAKVYLLQDEKILKLFRRKRFFSSALLRPYSKRFIDNAQRLSGLGIPTLSVMEFYSLEAPGMTAVLYQPLPGQTLRQIAQEPGFSWPQMLPALIDLIRNLHESGIYFRSLHLGNVVRTPEGKLGLIDVADMRFFKTPLPQRLIKRNLQHFARYLGREQLNDDFPLQSLEQALLSR